eukprot:g45546.t1
MEDPSWEYKGSAASSILVIVESEQGRLNDAVVHDLGVVEAMAVVTIEDREVDIVMIVTGEATIESVGARGSVYGHRGLRDRDRERSRARLRNCGLGNS